MVLIAGALIYHVTRARPQFVAPLKIAFASGVMGLVVWFGAAIPLLIIIPVAVGVYGVTLLAVRGITVSEIKDVLRL